jgi:hypothetical protein
MRWIGTWNVLGEKINAYRILVGKIGGNSPLEISRSKYENNIKMDVRYLRYEIVEWIHLAQARESG